MAKVPPAWTKYVSPRKYIRTMTPSYAKLSETDAKLLHTTGILGIRNPIPKSKIIHKEVRAAVRSA